MRFALTDTIAAIATPPGTSALAILRVSGNHAIEIASSIFSKPKELLSALGYQAVHGYIKSNSHTIDEVVCLVYRTPHSFTGEDMVEITCHGNPDLANQILNLLLTSCRMAEAGEFTFRAFMNHKLDLVQAEAVCDLISAQTAKAEQAALNQLKGRLSESIKYYIDALTECRIQFELAIDFSDQELPEIDMPGIRARMDNVLLQLELLLKEGKQGKVLRDGYNICLAGAPNVGKSSLFNLILKENRAIVTPHPGTTRDYLEEWLSIEGYPIHLIDTAGLRETQDSIEQMGIDKSNEQLAKADLILYLTDPDTIETDTMLPELMKDNRTLPILNKVDLLGFSSIPLPEDWQAYLESHYQLKDSTITCSLIPVSLFIPDSLKILKSAIVNRIAIPDHQISSVLVTNTRHLSAIEHSIHSLSNALKSIEHNSGYEFTAFDLIEAISSLSEITGAITTDDMLERIFSNFCIGK